jgi:four helix bundle protein
MGVDKKEFDLQERLIDFAVLMLEIVGLLPNTKVGNHIAGQLVKSGTSPAPNYGEAQSAESRNNFIHKMKICLKELRETEVWLKIVKRTSLIKPVDIVKWGLAECYELILIFGSSINTAEANKK